MTIKVDLLPTEKKQFGIDPAMIVMFLLIVAAGVAMLFRTQNLASQIEDQKAQIEQINQEIKQVESQLPLIDETKNRIANLKREIKMIKSLVHDPLRYANLLQEVAILLPENVWLDDLAINPTNNKVDFSGHASEVVGERKPLATIADLMRNFNDSQYFTGSSLASATESAGEGKASVFSFKLTIDYDPEKAANDPPTGMGKDSVPKAEPDKETPHADAEDNVSTAEAGEGAEAAATPAATTTP